MTAEEHFRRAVELFDAGKFVDAAEYAWGRLLHRPDDGQLWQLYGVASFNLNDHAAAKDALERATCLVPLHPLARLALARCFARDGQVEPALTIYEHLADGACPNELLPSVAADLNGMGRHDLALRACRTLTRRDPSHHQAFFGVAFYLARLGNAPETLIAPLATAFALAPHVRHYRLNLAFALADAGRADEAAGLLDEFTLDDLPCAYMLRRVRDVFEAAGDFSRALDCARLLADRSARA